ncbi:hypothetical protein EHS25_004115 [Saitozyma podzolica]|uniref:Uncharacterized protein n=1 Tax=Saitozyma podzolica TaxID=1890683 RepID=A0A427YTA6_9TREE|nr:hypothetical protein EHS25_004115 [Saitozyma podzolica]
MSSNPSSSPTIGSDDNQLEKTTSVGSTSSHGSSSSRSRIGNLFGRLRKSSANLRGAAEASAASDLIGTDTPRAASPVTSAPESESALSADMQAKVFAARSERDRAASVSEASQTQSTTSHSQSAAQSATQTATQSSTKPPARYGSKGYTEQSVSRKDAANSYHAAGAQKAIDAFNKQASQYRSQEE